MKDFDKNLQYNIDNNIRHVSKKQASSIGAKQAEKLQACLDLHYQLNDLKVKPAFGHQALRNTLTELDAVSEAGSRFRWSNLKLGATALASLVIVLIIGGFSWFGTNQTGSELSQDNVKPNGTVENLQNLNLADAENDTKALQSDSSSVSTAEADLSNTSNIDEAINENF